MFHNDDPSAATITSAAPPLKLPPVAQRIQEQTPENPAPICVLICGMAGSGKTTLMSQLQQSTIPEDEEDPGGEDGKHQQSQAVSTNEQDDGDDKKPAAVSSTTTTTPATTTNNNKRNKIPAYCINLDPATLDVPYSPSIDIRDTVDYKQVMQQHHLGPNGAIMTSLNLYATKFDQVIRILEQRADNQQLSEFLLVDTPGQIEAFTWSASGSILSESLASTFPTVLVFVVDTVRCASSPNTFMSNMLYACSMYYRTRLPLVIAFNKTDVVSHEFCMEWMKDFEAFQEALDNARNENGGESSSGFYDSLTRSLSLVLDEFYSEFSKNAVGVSAVTGDGIEDFWAVIRKAASTDFGEYLDDLKLRIREQEAKRQAIARAQARRLQQDVQNTAAAAATTTTAENQSK
ncbi:GTPase [Nitzschia inconspicua]|uniref:GPN-loop GTPase n=1 Tax=Nitzschia inconspicua TaxID=303405 RepID=A0A9K3K7G0_9STRA|nr:GTPase [Nitzschia inconspicua]KAG7358669.1 GTPase [Nitzschia inconspicua]